MFIKTSTGISEIEDIADWKEAGSLCADRGNVLESNKTVLSEYFQQNNNVQSLWSGSYIAMLPWMEILVLNDTDIQLDIPTDTFKSCVYSDCISSKQRYEKDFCSKPYIALCSSFETTEVSTTLTSIGTTHLQKGFTEVTDASNTPNFTLTTGLQNATLERQKKEESTSISACKDRTSVRVFDYLVK
ncbi:unnamed protein product [Mytilus coruscus]|uniref:Uncharacterized protein n=1 Tax=Mytilus coruscus TaxID=42192 RepID=A0A6J8AGG5_MYTCO|nr:unnamed protein product [Mytilus coruscus]